MAPQQADLLAAVERSPQAAAAHDRDGWVGLFTADGRIEDPVGSQPHVGRAAIGRFYDTFIGPRDIVFHRDLDVVVGPVVVRDLTLEVAMGAVTMRIPAFLRYDLREVDGEWKIAVLRAYWELPAMTLQFLRHGAVAAPAGVQLASGLVRNQGWRGTAGFAAGFRRAGARSRKLVTGFVSAVGRGDTPAATRTLSPGATISLGEHDIVGLPDLVERVHAATCGKVVGAGSTVAAAVTTAQSRGVMFADVATRRPEISRTRYFAGPGFPATEAGPAPHRGQESRDR